MTLVEHIDMCSSGEARRRKTHLKPKATSFLAILFCYLSTLFLALGDVAIATSLVSVGGSALVGNNWARKDVLTF